MQGKELLVWLEKENLLDKTKSFVEPLKNVLKNSLAASDEPLLIIGDKGFQENRIAPILSGGYYLASKELNIPSKIIVQEPKFKGDPADPEVIDSLYNLPSESIAILSLSNKLGSMKDLGGSFRTYCKEKKHRFASAVSLGNIKTSDYLFLKEAINVDYNELIKTGNTIKKRMDKTDEVNITTDAGTDLYMNIKGKTALANVGDYKNPGTGGNIPCGEVYTPPKWKHVEGKVVIDGSISCREGTILVKEPVTLKIEKDEVIDIKGGKEAKQLENTLEWAYNKAKHPWGVRRIGELGIGINNNAKIIGATIIDEKAKGTAHVAIGSNHWFGGTIYAIIHLDQVFRNPKIRFDGELLNI